jgi:predicted alpha-1,6-mannanase (GH76 family)
MWWESANIAESIAKFGIQDASFRPAAIDIISNTYTKSPNQFNYTNWHNGYYDDMGWWAMAWIASYDLTHDQKYLNTARDLFDAMTTGETTPCGGIWWDKAHTSIATISNSLFLTVGASLASRTSGSDRTAYQHAAEAEWDWLSKPGGAINAQNLLNDGVISKENDPNLCKNDGKLTWTYNQGVLLTGLAELANLLPASASTLLSHANTLVDASTTLLAKNAGDILTEPTNPPLDQQAAMFKGAYIRNLGTLQALHPKGTVKAFLQKNIKSLVDKARGADGVFQDLWQGGGRGSVTAHASGVDLLVAALRAGVTG